jgi:sarcosine oxidase subunit beta
MTSSKGASVVIVGGGVTGLSAGWHLARAGCDVVVVDKGVIGYEASSRNGGGASHYHSPLFAEEQRLWPMMDELLGYPTEYRRERVIVALTEAQLAHYHYMAAMFNELGYTAEHLDVQQALEMAPLVSDKILGGIHLKFGGQANPQRTVQAYAWAMQDHGGRILQHAQVTGFETTGGKVSAVVTSRGTLGCDALVIAAGPQTEGLAAQLGAFAPMAPARAEMIITEPAPLMPIGGVDGNGLYGRQTLRGNLAYGGGPHEWIDVEAGGPGVRPTTPLMRNLAKRVAELLPKAEHLRVIRSWAGVIETTPDGRPILDRLKAPDNVVIASMSGVGFGLSPASGHAISDLVLEGRCTFADIDKLGLDRFAGLAPDWRAERGWTAVSAAV